MASVSFSLLVSNLKLLRCWYSRCGVWTLSPSVKQSMCTLHHEYWLTGPLQVVAEYLISVVSINSEKDVRGANPRILSMHAEPLSRASPCSMPHPWRDISALLLGGVSDEADWQAWMRHAVGH